MTEGVVDGLDVVEVDKHHRTQGWRVGVEGLGGPGLGIGAVEQPGQRVVAGLVGEPPLRVVLVGDVGDVGERGDSAGRPLSASSSRRQLAESHRRAPSGRS